MLRKEVKWRAERFELMPTFSVTFHDAYVQKFIVGLDLNYHITNWVSVGLTFGYAFNRNTNLTNQVNSILTQKTEVTKLGFLILANGQFSPIFGKFMMFSKLLVNYDLHVTVGVGVAQLKSNGDVLGTKFALAPLAGVGFRLLFAEFIGVNLEFRDLIVKQALNVTKNNTFSSSFVNNFMFTLGISVLLPIDAKTGD